MAAEVLVLILLLSFILSASAVEAEPGGVYSEGTELTASPYGVTLSVPAGQMATIGEDEIAIGNLLSALGSTVTATRDDLATLKASLGQPLVTESVTWNASQVRVEGGHLLAELEGTTLLGGARIGRLEAIPGKHGWTVVVITAGKPKHRSQLDSFHATLVGTIRLGAPSSQVAQASASGSSGGGATTTTGPALARSGPWAQQLAGRHFRYMRTGSTTSSETHLWLCADGRAFYARESSGGGVPGAEAYSYASQDDAAGTWGVQGNTLIAANSEERAEWTLSRASDGVLLLDGDRWLEMDVGGKCR